MFSNQWGILPWLCRLSTPTLSGSLARRLPTQALGAVSDWRRPIRGALAPLLRGERAWLAAFAVWQRPRSQRPSVRIPKVLRRQVLRASFERARATQHRSCTFFGEGRLGWFSRGTLHRSGSIGGFLCLLTVELPKKRYSTVPPSSGLSGLSVGISVAYR